MPLDGGADRDRPRGRHRPVLDRLRRFRLLEQVLQRRDRGLGLRELRLQAVEVRADQRVAGADIRRREHRAHRVDRHVEIAEAADHLRGRDLIGRVVAVAVARIDVGGLEQTDAVVVAQRLRAEMRHPGEVTDRQRRGHVAHAPPSREGKVNCLTFPIGEA